MKSWVHVMLQRSAVQQMKAFLDLLLLLKDSKPPFDKAR